MATNGDVGPNKYGPDPKNILKDEIDDIGKSAKSHHSHGKTHGHSENEQQQH